MAIKARTFRDARGQAKSNPELAWCDVTHRGYAAAKLTPTRADVDWIAFDSVTTATATTPTITRSTAETTRDHGVGPWAFA